MTAPTRKDTTLTIGSMLLEWLGTQCGSAATLAGFLLLAVVLPNTRQCRSAVSVARTRRHHR